MDKMRENWILGASALLGLCFWFSLGFPFGHHNESYAWLSDLEAMNFASSLAGVVGPVVTPRPLGIFTAWLLFQLGDGNIAFIEAFNFLSAVLGWGLLFYTSVQKRTFALISLGTTGVLFSGYIYLFHLHGVFYSPLLVLIAFVCWQSAQTPSIYRLCAFCLAGVVASLFHPFAYLFVLAFLPAYLFEKSANKKLVISGGLLFLMTLSLMKLTTSGAGLPLGFAHIDGLVISYGSVEVHSLVKLFSLVLCLLTVMSLGVSYSQRQRIALATLLFVGIFWWLSLPIVMLWVLVCGIKLCFLKRWALAAILGVAFALPAITATGSPTYTVFAIFISTFATAYNWSEAEAKLEAPWFINTAVGALACSIGLATILRLGYPVPGISRLAQPLLAEREKTWQLNQVLDWYLGSRENGSPLLLHVDAGTPRLAGNVVNRKNRPPTQQEYLDNFLASRSALHEDSGARQLRITFGQQDIPQGRLVFAVAGNFSGKAQVFLVEPLALNFYPATKK